jgi:hypothetical protein
VDNTLDVQVTPHSSRSRAIAAALLVLIASTTVFMLVRQGSDARRSDPEIVGPPPGVAPVATGTLDGVAWEQFAWSAPGGMICLQFAAGASSTDCGRWNHDASPFALLLGDSPITDGQHGASTTVVQGIVDPAVTSLGVVEPVGTQAVGTLTECPCPDAKLGLSAFVLPLTERQTLRDSDGRFVMIAAFVGETEVGRVRVQILNLGYCGRDDCT